MNGKRDGAIPECKQLSAHCLQNIIKKYSAGDHKKQGGTDAQKKDRSVYGSKQHFRDRLSQEAKKYGHGNRIKAKGM